MGLMINVNNVILYVLHVYKLTNVPLV